MFQYVRIYRLAFLVLTLYSNSFLAFANDLSWDSGDKGPDTQAMQGRALNAVVSELQDGGYSCTFPTPTATWLGGRPTDNIELQTKCSRIYDRLFADRWDEFETIIYLRIGERLSDTSRILVATSSGNQVRSHSMREFLSFPTGDGAVVNYVKDDLQLNAAFKKVLTIAQNRRLGDSPKDTREMIVAFEKSWIRFRDSYCNLYAQARTSETKAQDVHSLQCKSKVNTEQIRFLEGMYRCLQNPQNRCELPLFGYAP